MELNKTIHGWIIYAKWMAVRGVRSVHSGMEELVMKTNENDKHQSRSSCNPQQSNCPRIHITDNSRIQ